MGNTMVQAFETAVRLHSVGRLTEAEGIYRDILRETPDHPRVLHGLALICSQTARMPEALALYARAESLSPQDAGVRGDFGNLLFRLGRFDEARVRYEHMIALEPRNAAAHTNLGSAFRALAQLDRALASYQNAIKLDSRLVEPRVLIGGIYLVKGQFANAQKAFVSVVETSPTHPAALEGLGNALNAQGKPVDALATFQRLLVVRPDSAAALFGIANAQQQIGNVTEGRRALEQAVLLAPGIPKLHYALAKTAKFSADDDRLAGLKAIESRSDQMSPEDQATLHFALAKADDDLDRCEDAFAHWTKANALKRGVLNYNAADEAAEIRAFQKIFPQDLFANRKQDAQTPDVPIFIVGMPRSGTSLVEQILSCDPEVFAAGEQSLLEDTAYGIAGEPSIHWASSECVKEIGGRYLAQLRNLAPNAKHITDKMPGNFRLIGLIHRALPAARIVHVRRDAMATCFSCFTTLFESTLDFSYDLADLGKIYSAYEELMVHWRLALPDGVMLEIKYEDLVADFEGQARSLLTFCGQAWDPRCLQFYAAKNAVRTASQMEVRQPLYATSVDRWRRYEPWLQPLNKALNCR